MNFLLTETVKDLAKQKGISINRLEKELHLANKSIAVWDKSRPSIDRVAAVADYFGVSIDSICGRVGGDFLNTKEQTLLSAFRSMTAEGQAYLMQTAELAAARFLKTPVADPEVIA